MAKRRTRVRQPLSTTSNSLQHDQMKATLMDIFDKSQYSSTTNVALTQLKKLFRNSNFDEFEPLFKSMLKRFLHSPEHTNYFKTTCEFLCKFLQHEQKPVSSENNPNIDNTKTTANTREKKGRKRKNLDSEDEDELISFLQTSQADNTTITSHARVDTPTITDHDRIISSCFEVADLFMQALSDTCRFNGVYLVCKFLNHCRSLDEEIIKAMQSRMAERIRDKKPKIRAQAVLACQNLQENKMIQEAFMFHFYRDPELVVRKALIQVMDTKIFKYGFLIDSTQDSYELMRTEAYKKIGKILPSELDSKQLHKTLHNGLNERERRVNYAFKTYTLETWLTNLYDGLNLRKLLSQFDCIEYYEDISKLLDLVYTRDSEKIENNGATTKLHHVVETFRQQNFNEKCIPLLMDQVDEKMVSIWFSLVKFCKTNQSLIKSVKIRTVVVEQENQDINSRIERILDTNERTDDVVELYERLVPDLVNLIEFLKNFTEYCHEKLESSSNLEHDDGKFEFIYHRIMEFILTYEIGDEIERKTVQEVLGCILKDNLLTGYFKNYIEAIIKCLNQLIYSSNPNQMLNYVSEIINNVRSHLEDVITTMKHDKNPTNRFSTIQGPNQKQTTSQQIPKSAKKVRIAERYEHEDLECEIAKRRVDLEELNDKMELCIKEKDFDEAKVINNRISELKSEITNLHERRYSMASDISHMSMVIDNEVNGKLSSTIIADNSLCESDVSMQDDEELKIFKDHPNDLIKCLQMYFACLQNVKIREVPPTMLNHLNLLSYECLDESFKTNAKVRSLMVVCNGITALRDVAVAKATNTMTLLISACFDPKSIEVKTSGFVSLVDIILQHKDLEFPEDRIESFLTLILREYGKYDSESCSKSELEFAEAIIDGTSKLFFYKKLSSSKILSHFILWWYHPNTEAKLRQFIGIFLPMFVKKFSMKQLNSNCENEQNDTWLQDLLEETFILSIEYLHKYIAGPGKDIMEASDMLSLINFLCNLVPVAFHANIQVRLDERIDDLSQNKNTDLVKYLKQAKKTLMDTSIVSSADTPLAEPIETTVI